MQTAYTSPRGEHSPASAMILASILRSFKEPAHARGAMTVVQKSEPLARDKKHAGDVRVWAAIFTSVVILCAAVNLAALVAVDTLP